MGLQSAFIDYVQPNILAASQDHGFGINNIYTLAVRNKYYDKIQMHVQNIKHILYWIFLPIYLILDVLKWGIKYMKLTRKLR